MSEAPKPRQQLALNIAPPEDYSEDSFVLADCNLEAYRWLVQWPDWPIRLFAIYGEQGCGKSHLAYIWQKRSKAIAINNKTMQNFHPADVVQQADAFILDIKSEEILEDWLFHFYNHLKEQNKYLLICSRIPPGQWPIKLPDLKSRLRSIFCIPLLSPDDNVINQVLTKLLQEKGIEVKQNIIDFLVNRCQRSFTGIYKLSQAIDEYTLANKRPLTMPVAKAVLDNINIAKEDADLQSL